MAMTFKKRKDGIERAAFQIHFGLTREEVALIERVAEASVNVSPRELLRNIALKAIKEMIAANKR